MAQNILGLPSSTVAHLGPTSSSDLTGSSLRLPAPKVTAGPMSAKYSKRKGRVPPSPIVKFGASSKGGYAKRKNLTSRGLSSSRRLVHELEEFDSSEDAEVVVKASEGKHGWDDLSTEELAVQVVKEREATRESAPKEEKQRMRKYFNKRPASECTYAVQASGNAVQHPLSGPNTPSLDRSNLAPLTNTVERGYRFFLPLSLPVDDSGSSGDNGSVLALLATSKDRAAPLSPLSNVPEASASRPEPTREDSSDPHAGTSVVSQSSVISKASTMASSKGHAAGKRSTAATSKARRSHGGPTRPGLVHKHSTGANAGKTSLVAGAIRRSSSTASGVGEVSVLRALTSMPPPAALPADKDKKRPPPVQTDAPASKVAAGPTSAKSPKGKGRVPPSPVVKAGARGKGGYAKGKKFTSRGLTRSKSLVHEPEEESDESEDGEVVNAGDEDDEDGWDDLSAEELAAQAAREKEAARERTAEEEKQRMREYFKKRPASEYANLGRTKSTGLLSQLLNPDPNLFPPEHPYRQAFSTDNLTQLPYAHLHQQQSPYRRTQSSLATQLRRMTSLQLTAPRQPQNHPPLQVERQTQPVRAAVPAGLSAAPARATAGPTAAATRTPATSCTPLLAAIGGVAPSLKITKSSAALPAMETFNAAGSSAAVSATTAMTAVSLAKANLTIDRSNSKLSMPSAHVQSPTASQAPTQAPTQAQPPAQVKKPSPGGSGGLPPLWGPCRMQPRN
jgi:hypothetical protein